MPDLKETAVAPIPVSPAPRETLQDFVYAKVKALILNGELEPGRTITMRSLATAFSVSHMPVREALQRLTAERALTLVAGRSMGIPPLSIERLEDFRRVRLEVEGLAAAWSAAHIDGARLPDLEQICAELDRAVAAGDVRSYLRHNCALHFGVYRGAGSPTLMSMIEPLWLQISPYFSLLHGSGNYIEANRCHRAMIEALRRRDAEAVRAAVRADIEASTAGLRTLLRPAPPG